MEIYILLYLIIILVIGIQIKGNPIPKDGTWTRNKPYENPELYEGDMLFPVLPSPMGRGVALRGASVPWTNGIVPYEISPGYASTQQSFIIATMQKMERLIAINNVACIQFRPKISSDLYYITIVNGYGCSSYVFYHEQSRPDRDSYVRVNYGNIQSGYQNNFDKYSNTTVDTQNTPYDYSSVMHYERDAFSSNGLPTIEPLQANVTIGQRDNMSSIDIQEVRLFYHCLSSGVTLSPIPTTTTVNLYVINTTISSSLTSSTQKFARYNGSGSNYYYNIFIITVPVLGSYVLSSNSSIDTFGYIYTTTFYPSYSYYNLMAYDDDSGGNRQFKIIMYLQANVGYVLVVTTNTQYTTGSYSITVSGLNTVSLLKSTDVTTTTIRSVATSASISVNSMSLLLCMFLSILYLIFY